MREEAIGATALPPKFGNFHITITVCSAELASLHRRREISRVGQVIVWRRIRIFAIGISSLHKESFDI